MNKNAIRIIRNIYWQSIENTDKILSKSEYENNKYLQDLKINVNEDNIDGILVLFNSTFSHSKLLRIKLFKELTNKYKNNFNILYLFLKESPELYKSLTTKTLKLIELEFSYLKENFSNFSKYLQEKNIHDINTVLLTLLISNQLKEKGNVKIRVKLFKFDILSEKSKIKVFKLTQENLKRTIELINNNQRIYYLKPSFKNEKINYFEYKTEDQSEEENAYIHDYITAIGNVLFSFNNFLLELVYNYCEENKSSYLINQNREYNKKINILRRKYKNLFNIPENLTNMTEKDSKHFFTNFINVEKDYVLKNQRLKEININGLKDYINKNYAFFITRKNFHIMLDTDNDSFKELSQDIINKKENNCFFDKNKIKNMNEKEFNELLLEIQRNYNLYILDNKFEKLKAEEKTEFLEMIIRKHQNNNLNILSNQIRKIKGEKCTKFFNDNKWFKDKYLIKTTSKTTIKELYFILLEKYKKDMSYGVEKLINFLNKEINQLEEEYKNINNQYYRNKCDYPKTHTIDDIFDKNINNNNITKLVSFFVEKKIVPERYKTIFQLYELIFRHQYAHGFNDFFKSLLVNNDKVLISNQKVFSHISNSIIPNFKYLYYQNKQYIKINNLCSQEQLRIYLSKYSINNPNAFMNEVNNKLYDKYFLKNETEELHFQFKKASYLLELKNLSKFSNNEQLKVDIQQISIIYKNLAKFLKKNNLNINDYIIIDSEEYISLNKLVQEINEFIMYVAKRW